MPHRTPSGQRTSLLAALAIVVAGAACHSSTEARVASGLAFIGGTGESAVVGTPLPIPVSVRVVDQNGNGIADVAVSWSTSNGGGSLDFPATSTDANGETSVNWTLGGGVGVDSLHATLAHGATIVTTATGTVGPFATLAIAGGNAQTIPAGTTSQPLAVTATDRFGNVVANVTVTWLNVGAGTLNVTTSKTGADGVARATLTTDPIAASYSVQAQAPGANPVTFTLTAN
jgi:hypothetical protein